MPTNSTNNPNAQYNTGSNVAGSGKAPSQISLTTAVPSGLTSAGVLNNSSVYAGFNAAGVSRNNPGPNAAGQPRSIPVTPASDFLFRAGISDPNLIAAVTVLVDSAIHHGWWSKCDLIYPFIGGTALAHAQNLKSSAFSIAWNGTVTHDANGVTGNGVDGYGDTGFIPSSSSAYYTLNDAHIGLYRRTIGNGSRYAGALQTATTSFRHTFSGNLLNILNGGASAGRTTTALGAMMTSRSANVLSVRDTGGETNAASVATALTTNALVILAQRNADPTVGGFSTVNLGGFTLGGSMTLAQFNVYAADWQNFQAAVGRQV